MTLEELKNLAQSGDIDAGIEVAQYYLSKGTYQDTVEALKWSEMIAEKGSGAGAYLSMTARNLCAVIDQSKMVGDWAGAQNNWEQTEKWARKVIQRVDDGDEHLGVEEKREAQAMIEECFYGCAVSLYHLKKYENAITLLANRTGTREKMLLAMSKFSAAKDEKDYASAFVSLKQAFADSEYLVNGAAHQEEEHIYALAAKSTAGLYRIGIRGTVQSDLKKSVEILQAASGKLKDTDYRGMITKELTRYKKKFFGGYTYVS